MCNFSCKTFISKFILLLIIGNAIPYLSDGQTKSELEERRKENEKQIEYTNRLLVEIRETRVSSLERLNVINERIKLRELIITSLTNEVKIVENEIQSSREAIFDLENELQESRENYARMIRNAYKNRFGYNYFLFLLSADNFNQAYRRYRYLQQYTNERNREIEKIEKLKKEIEEKIIDNEKKRRELESLLLERRREAILLEDEKDEQRAEIQQLKRKEEELKDEIKRREEIANNLQKEIDELIAEGSEDTETGYKFHMSPEEKIVSEEFEKNKGGLPWPTEDGIVTGYFGEHSHPVLNGIIIQNNGIDILTSENAEVRTIFNGEVRRVVEIPGSSNAVLIRHGDYLTVYSNLNEVFVKPGQIVSMKEIIGKVYTDADNGDKAILHLEIWEKESKMDPLQWLSR